MGLPEQPSRDYSVRAWISNKLNDAVSVSKSAFRKYPYHVRTAHKLVEPLAISKFFDRVSAVATGTADQLRAAAGSKQQPRGERSI